MITRETATAIAAAHERIELLESLWSVVGDFGANARIAVQTDAGRFDLDIAREDLIALLVARLEVRRAELLALNQQAAEEAKS